MKISRKLIVILLFTPLFLLFCFLNTSPFSAWCGTPEMYIFSSDNFDEIEKRIEAFYLDNDNNNVWNWDSQKKDYINSFYQSTSFEEFRKWSFEYFLPEKRRTVAVTLCITQDECHLDLNYFTIKAESLNWNDKSIVVEGDKKKILNSLQNSEEKEDVLKDFENNFLDKLNIAYYRCKPEKENIVFSNVYLFLHPKYSRHYKMLDYEKTYKSY